MNWNCKIKTLIILFSVQKWYKLFVTIQKLYEFNTRKQQFNLYSRVFYSTTLMKAVSITKGLLKQNIIIVKAVNASRLVSTYMDNTTEWLTLQIFNSWCKLRVQPRTACRVMRTLTQIIRIFCIKCKCKREATFHDSLHDQRARGGCTENNSFQEFTFTQDIYIVIYFTQPELIFGGSLQKTL